MAMTCFLRLFKKISLITNKVKKEQRKKKLEYVFKGDLFSDIKHITFSEIKHITFSDIKHNFLKVGNTLKILPLYVNMNLI